jgi:hypothetical protein
MALLMTKSVTVQRVKDNISATRTISALCRCCPPRRAADLRRDARHPAAPAEVTAEARAFCF